MVLSDISIKRPVFAVVVSLLLVTFGVMSFSGLPLRELPDIDPPEVSIDVTYRGASAEVVETRVTDVIEEQLTGLEGVETITSSTTDGQARIQLEFKLSRDLDEAANDVRDAVARAAGNLPLEIDPPRVRKANSDASPIMWFNLASTSLDDLELTDFGNRTIVDRLSVVEGVARVFLGGEQEFSMRIWLDPLALAARGLTVTDVETALREQNLELPAGSVEGADRDFTVRVERSYARPADFRRLVVAQGEDGRLVRLGDVAQVRVGAVERRSMFRGNGQSMIGVGIVAQSKTNILDVAKNAREAVEQIRKTLPEDIVLADSFDSSVFVEEAIREVGRTLFVAVILVVAVIYLFLGNLRAAAVPAVVVPVCLAATFIVIAALGLTINLITLLALILAIGLVVDDSIVVLENIQRRVDQGDDPLVGAYIGARQVGFAVIATTLVLIAVFASLAFLQGFVGRLFQELAITISAAVAFSSVVALSLSPMMCSKLLKSRAFYRAKGKRMRNPVARWFGDRVEATADAYGASLGFVLGRPIAILAALSAVTAFAAFLFIQSPKDLAPQEDRGGFRVFAQTPEGSGFDYTVEQIAKVEAVVLDYLDNGEADRVLVRVPGFGSNGSFNSGIVIVNLNPWGERRPIADIVEEVQGRLNEIPGVFTRVGQRSSLARTDGTGDVGFVLLGAEYDQLNDWADLLIERGLEWGGFQFLRKNFEPTSPRLRVAVDRDRAADLGVSVADVGRTLEVYLGGRRTGTYVDRGEEYDIITQATLADRRSTEDLANFFVRARSGDLVPLSNLITLEEYADSAERNHFNRTRSVTVQGSLVEGYTQADALAFLEDVVLSELPDDAQFDYSGGSRQYVKSSSDFAFVFGLSLAVVFLVLAAQFESFLHPLAIMLTVPAAALGGLFGLYAAGASINIYSQIGLLILIGLAAKNGILIVEFANQLRDEGKSVADAIVEACRIRFRPVVMTAISTAMGAAPLMLSEGAGSESRAVIGVTIVSGTVIGTLLTLYFCPAFYHILAPFTHSPNRIAKMLNKGLRDHPEAQPPGAVTPAE